MRSHNARRFRRLTALLTLTLGGGALLNLGASCDTRLRTAVVQGAQDYLFNIFFPQIAEDFAPET